MGMLGDAFVENPIMRRMFDKMVRKKIYSDYAEFIRQADLTPQQQLEFYKLLSDHFRESMKTMMTGMGENMTEMRTMMQGESGVPDALAASLSESQVALKDNLQGALGDENFDLLRDMSREKKSKENYRRMKNRMKWRGQELSDEQAQEMEVIYSESSPGPLDNGDSSEFQQRSSEVLTPEQMDILNKSGRGRQFESMLLPI